MIERTHLLNLRVSDDELAKLKALADANDESMARIVRRWISSFYRERFGTDEPREMSNAKAPRTRSAKSR